MSENYKIKITKQAYAQMEVIGRYIAFELLSPETADKLLALLKLEIASLSFMPERFTFTEEEPWHSKGVRKMPVKNYLVYYIIKEEAKEVRVTAILHARQDQQKELLNMDM